MGVTLERVQNKFACIIGELCSEPVILSQFAIWVDLRIAEYKAKGAISLDCSGDEPEPVWLNGHRLPRKEDKERMLGRLGGRKSLSRPGGQASLHSSPSSRFELSGGVNQGDTPTNQGFLGEARLSPTLVVVKDEPTDTPSASVYPTGIHPHGSLASSNRKRAASETVSQGDGSFYQQQNTSVHSPSKVQRLSANEDSPHTGDTTSNQSLMSIISGDIEEQNQSSAGLNDGDIDIILDYESKNTIQPQREDNSSTAGLQSPEASTSSAVHVDMGDSFNQEGGSNTVDGIGNLSRKSDMHWTNPVGDCPPSASEENSVVVAVCNTELLTRLRHDIKHRLLSDVGDPPPAARHLIAAASTLECWLQMAKGDMRKVECIPPAELDPYLVEFFSLLKRRDGADYDPDGFGNFRSAMDHYLMKKNYPVSIRRSEAFHTSRLVFKMRRKALSEISRYKRIEKLNYEQSLNLNVSTVDSSGCNQSVWCP